MNNSFKKILFAEGFVTIIAVMLMLINCKTNFFSIPMSDVKDLQNNIVTISSVFAGFSFTVLGLLISLSSTNIMIKLKQTDVLSRKCVIISSSIQMFVVATIVSLSYVYIIVYKIENAFLSNQILIYGICHFTAGIILFVVSVIEMIVLLDAIFQDDKKNAKKKITDYKKSEAMIRSAMYKKNDDSEKQEEY